MEVENARYLMTRITLNKLEEVAVRLVQKEELLGLKAHFLLCHHSDFLRKTQWRRVRYHLKQSMCLCS
ncbi:hypothetical protein J437_LFUL009602 [Ladona fulva]|uniref:Uncharacterized protein n=1 Tax=Ladona fulva TaxID=123851 RepID=A0A8K0NWP0_LADFU|nr:hypothetical protein J437_LFUL009602 [Ladona fulva]